MAEIRSQAVQDEAVVRREGRPGRRRVARWLHDPAHHSGGIGHENGGVCADPVPRRKVAYNVSRQICNLDLLLTLQSDVPRPLLHCPRLRGHPVHPHHRHYAGGGPSTEGCSPPREAPFHHHGLRPAVGAGYPKPLTEEGRIQGLADGFSPGRLSRYLSLTRPHLFKCLDEGLGHSLACAMDCPYNE